MVKDHSGNEYINTESMCRAYNISHSLFCKRRNRGYTLEECLSGRHTVKDHLGISYPSQEAMCSRHGVSVNAYKKRLKKGLTLEQALTPGRRYVFDGRYAVKDDSGNVYPSLRAMLKEKGISATTYYYRKSQGLPLKECLKPNKRIKKNK